MKKYVNIFIISFIIYNFPPFNSKISKTHGSNIQMFPFYIKIINNDNIYAFFKTLQINKFHN